MYYDIAVSLAILQTIHIITAVPWSTPYSTIRGVVNMPMVGVDDSSLQIHTYSNVTKYICLYLV